MADQESGDFTAGGGKKLSIIRYGRELMTQHERQAGDNIEPGDAVMPNVNNNGVDEFVLHDGDMANTVYVAVEARGRGMDAQSDGYTADEDYCIAVRPAGGGLHLNLATGENATETDGLVVESGTGKFLVYDSGTDSAEDVFADADEALDLNGASSAGLVKAEVSN